jgi:polysaccharide export outer membrane protein
MNICPARVARTFLAAMAAFALAAAAHAQPAAQLRAPPGVTAAPPAATTATLSAPASDASAIDLADYKLGPGDVLQVQVLNAEQFNRKLRVDSIGNVSLPLLGNIRVAGLTPHEVETVIADVLREKYMNDPQVGVFVEESASLRFSIEGAVKTPNVFPLKGRVTLLQALAMGGGFTKVADRTQVRILRGAGAQLQTLVFDAERIREGKLSDPVVLGNDAIIVEASTAKTVFYETLDTIRGIVSFGTVR